MKTSERGVALIRDREGCVMKAYQDTEGVWTIGVGHTHGVTEGDRCTEEQATAWLAEDLAWAEAEVNQIAPLQQNQYDALASFIFNIGGPQFRASTMRRMLIAGEPTDRVAEQFDRWHIPADIITRRNGEKAQFLGIAYEARVDDLAKVA